MQTGQKGEKGGGVRTDLNSREEEKGGCRYQVKDYVLGKFDEYMDNIDNVQERSESGSPALQTREGDEGGGANLEFMVAWVGKGARKKIVQRLKCSPHSLEQERAQVKLDKGKHPGQQCKKRKGPEKMRGGSGNKVQINPRSANVKSRKTAPFENSDRKREWEGTTDLKPCEKRDGLFDQKDQWGTTKKDRRP